MALLFMDGFDHYATADITKKWTSGGSAATIAASSGRRGGGAIVMATATGCVTKSVTPSASFVVGVAFSLNGVTGTARPLITLADAGTTQCDLRLNPDLTLSVTRNGTALTGGTSTNTLTAGAFYYIEFKVTIADSISAGSCKVRVNGVDWITVTTGQDTKNTSNASASQVSVGPLTGSISPATWLFDDFYICDQSGAQNNDFLGDVRIDTLFPNADGNYSQFTPSSGADHYALVDESTPNTTDYNDGASVSDRDSYALGNLAALASQVIHGIQVNAACAKDDAGSKSASTFVRHGSTNGDGASVALGTSQVYISQVYETNPNGGGAWTESTVNAMEAGVRVTA